MERNEGWLVKHFLKAEPTLGGFALVRGSDERICVLAERPNLPD